MFLIRPQRLKVNDGLCLLVSNERLGIVWASRTKKLSFLPLAALFEAKERLEKASPLGVTELGKAFGQGSTFVIEASMYPAPSPALLPG